MVKKLKVTMTNIVWIAIEIAERIKNEIRKCLA